MRIESIRYQWDEVSRRLADEGVDTARSRHLVILIDAVTDELRRRVGQTYSLYDIAEVYDGAEDWVRDVIVRSVEPQFRAGIRDVSLIQDAAFGQYARGAVDYAP